MANGNGNAIAVKPWWKSASFWLTIITIAGLILDNLVGGGILPSEGWVAIVLGVIGLVTKRGMTENTVIKANAIVAAAKNGGAADPPMRVSKR